MLFSVGLLERFFPVAAHGGPLGMLLTTHGRQTDKIRGQRSPSPAATAAPQEEIKPAALPSSLHDAPAAEAEPASTNNPALHEEATIKAEPIKFTRTSSRTGEPTPTAVADTEGDTTFRKIIKGLSTVPQEPAPALLPIRAEEPSPKRNELAPPDAKAPLIPAPPPAKPISKTARIQLVLTEEGELVLPRPEDNKPDWFTQHQRGNQDTKHLESGGKASAS